MHVLPLALLVMATALAGPAVAQVTPSNLPADTIWYLHADLKQLRTAGSGKPLYDWINGEVFVELNDELGVDLNKEANTVTAFSDAKLGTVVVVDGPIAAGTREKVLAFAAVQAKLDMKSYDGRTYYHVSESGTPTTGNHSLDDLQESAYFSFDVKDKLIVASDENQLKTLLDSDGRLRGNHAHPGTLFVLTADRSFVQAGMRTDELASDGDDGNRWESNILRNTEQVAILVSGREELLAIEAQLVSREPGMARSLGDIANGLLSLQALNSELDPWLRDLLRTTRIDVKNNVLSINVAVDANQIVTMLNN